MNLPHSSSEFVIPISYGSTEVIATGKWAFQKPRTAFSTASCQEACPAGTPVAPFLYLASEGRYNEALRILLKENPFPGVCGRVCCHPCEINCNRAQYDESVSIRAVERYVFDHASDPIPETESISSRDSKKIAVVGSGPAGLSCAYFLALLGYEVTIYEARQEPGGAMRWGIPGYRLPKSVLKREIRRILDLGIKLETGIDVGKDIPFDELNRFDAVFLSPGAGRSLPLEIEGEDLKKVWRGSDFLGHINSGKKVRMGKEVIVIGGSNMAMDVSRSAMRLGSRVIVAYRRTRAEMPAIPEEIHEAEDEGIRFEFLVQPVKISLLETERLRIRFQRLRLGEPDQSHRPMPIPVKGKFITLEADHLITAVGEGIDLPWLPEGFIKNGLIDVTPSLVTTNRKVFAGGDVIDQPRTIVNAIAAGKRAAISIDLHLRGYAGDEIFSKIRVGNKGSLSMDAYLSGREGREWPEVKEVILYDKINPLYFEPSRRLGMRRLNPGQAPKDFSEVHSGFSSDEARLSASRCFSCGTCNYCYNCYFFCPEGVILLDPAHQERTVDLEHCKGCGTCAKACPRHAVEMRGLS